MKLRAEKLRMPGSRTVQNKRPSEQSLNLIEVCVNTDGSGSSAPPFEVMLPGGAVVGVLLREPTRPPQIPSPPIAMLNFTAQVNVWICLEPYDMRKSVNGLWQVAEEKMKLDPKTGAVFVFSNRSRNRLPWDDAG